MMASEKIAFPKTRFPSNNTASTTMSHDPPLAHESAPFVTTTDVLKSLNQALEDLAEEDDIAKPHFELQKRMSNGSTRRATPQEMQAADMETKIQQSAAQVESLSTWDEKKLWGEQQRQYGNKLYHQERYEQAIDVYLTCLVVAQQEKKYVPEAKLVGLLFLSLINNLAQSALQLKWYLKTDQFCSLALEHLDKKEDRNGNDDCDATNESQKNQYEHQQQQSPEYPQQIAKLYYKRGKARRLRGHYKDARADLDTALEWIDRKNDSTKSPKVSVYTDDETQARAASRRTVERELQLVAKAAVEARRNKQRQQHAMQQVLSTNQSVGSADGSRTPKESLFPEIQGKRTYSTLRASSAAAVNQSDSDAQELPQLTARQWYVAVIGRVAEKLLEWSGDEENMQKQD
jgi:tetratricopeptide (TPR) repeat protein